MDRIVVGVDGSHSSEVALRWALEEAAWRRATLEVVLAWDYPADCPGEAHLPAGESVEGDVTRHLEVLLKDPLGDWPNIPVLRRVEEGRAASVLLASARGVDLLVVGSRGRGGFTGLLLGSVSQQCVQHGPCPVVVVRGQEGSPGHSLPEPARRIVVGVDGSETASRALSWALDEARLHRAVVDVVHAWPLAPLPTVPYVVLEPFPEGLERRARQLLDGVVEQADTRDLPAVGRLVVPGGAAWALLEQVKGADLLVVGSRGRGGFAGLLLGSVSQQVVRHAPCPVVVVPPSS